MDRLDLGDLAVFGVLDDVADRADDLLNYRWRDVDAGTGVVEPRLERGRSDNGDDDVGLVVAAEERGLAEQVGEIARIADDAIASGEQQAVVLEGPGARYLGQRVVDPLRLTVDVDIEGARLRLDEDVLEVSGDAAGLGVVESDRDLGQPAVEEMRQEVAADVVGDITLVESGDELVPFGTGLTRRPRCAKSGSPSW